jgi:hypothetical protein
MDLSSISAALASAKLIKDTVQGLTHLKIESSSLARINDALNQANELLGSLFEAREELFRLQKENHELEKKVQAHDDWKARLAEYTKEETEGGAVVYESISNSPKHYACPRCVEKREIHMLQKAGNSGSFECPNCQKIYLINPRPPIKPPRTPGYNF